MRTRDAGNVIVRRLITNVTRNVARQRGKRTRARGITRDLVVVVAAEDNKCLYPPRRGRSLVSPEFP